VKQKWQKQVPHAHMHKGAQTHRHTHAPHFALSSFRYVVLRFLFVLLFLPFALGLRQLIHFTCYF